ncbi:MAG: zinc ribbon domain-containing protein [Candidatus Promineofilum sp.]|nr:zinc ribbon domain-containing protein [Promineifilum sp.]
MSIVSCPNCGHPNVDSAKFCAKCGNKLTSGETLVMGGASDPNMPPALDRAVQPAAPRADAADDHQ